MPEERRRLFRLLRRTAKSTGNALSGRTAAEESALWGAHDRALLASRETSDAVQRISSTLAKQRGVFEATIDRSRALSARANDVTTALTRLSALFERLGLVALNAGLEGARLGEQSGAALRLVGDDVRAHALTGQESSRELATGLAELAQDLTQLLSSLERSRDASSEVVQEAARASGSAAEAERAVSDLGERLKKATGSDPETVRVITDATEHARALVASLGMLRGKVPQTLVLSALRPVLEPLGRMLEDDEDHDGDHDGEKPPKQKE